MSPPGEDDTMRIGDLKAKSKSDKDNSAPRQSDAINMSQSQPPKTTFTFALKPMSTRPFMHTVACNGGIKLVVDLDKSGPSFAQVVESNIRRSVEMYDFESFHGEIQFLETNKKNLLELSKMDMPMTLKENTPFPHSSRDDIIENHAVGSPDAPEIPLVQICGRDSQKKRTSTPSCNVNVHAMATENVAGTSLGEVNNNQFSIILNHDVGSPDAPEIPLMQISGSDSQKKRTSASSCNDSVHAMATGNVAGTSNSEVNNTRFTIRANVEELCGRINNQKAPIEMENPSDKASNGRKQGKGYLKRYNKIDGIQNKKKVRFEGCSSKDVHDPKEKGSGSAGK